MNAEQFLETYGFRKPSTQKEIDMILMSNLSNLQIEITFEPTEVLNEKLNNLKKFILDCQQG